jgi:hypothetical protein
MDSQCHEHPLAALNNPGFTVVFHPQRTLPGDSGRFSVAPRTSGLPCGNHQPHRPILRSAFRCAVAESNATHCATTAGECGRTYSITWSARARNEAGTSIPSALGGPHINHQLEMGRLLDR